MSWKRKVIIRWQLQQEENKQQYARFSNIKINQAYKSIYGLRKPNSDKIVRVQPKRFSKRNKTESDEVALTSCDTRNKNLVSIRKSYIRFSSNFFYLLTINSLILY